MHRRHAVVLPLASLAPTAWAGKALRVLAWPGYAEPEVVQAFERAHGVRVELTVIDSDEALWQRLRRQGDFDVLAINTAELQRAVNEGLVQALDETRLKALPPQLPRFRDASALPGLTRRLSGRLQIYGVPFTYAEMGLIFDRRQISQPPESIAELWNPRWRGKVLGFDTGGHNFSLAAQSLGLPSPFRLSDADWPRAVERLIALRRNVLSFYSQPDEATQLFRRHGCALMFANYGSQQLTKLKLAGADVGYALPREGALAWLDCWALTKACRDPALAHQWIAHLLGPQASRLLVERQGLANTVSAQGSPAGSSRLIWLEPVEDAARRERLWARVRSGDRAERVLRP
ncbi:putative spermidine/putrescine transport system substrate-binding protein [Inhella inkyongensis]|uniref:Putative spermidine/putrescine transport system substrate-binding protein n=1 Tax=Inhella inkyongensis TaxID=392593 RepID=A0A840RYX7_9BURK|nr:extracellular solute-binding protein [Inhella inkyongensis]MBB5202753.1 putative spermidine/putrescine transport system substrate-binding protein [Inhella inkyongensis]